MQPWPFLISCQLPYSSSYLEHLQGAAVGYIREDKSISVEPVWVLGVEGHELVEEDMGSWCAAHRGTGMTRVGFEGGIDLSSQLPSAWVLFFILPGQKWDVYIRPTAG